MILYYAMGGGLEHRTRARSVIHSLGIKQDTPVLTASRFANDPRVTGGFPVIIRPHDSIGVAACRSWLEHVVNELEPTEFLVDTFPGGINGELCDFAPLENMTVCYLARLLRWGEYVKVLRGALPPRAARTLRLEPLNEDQERFIRTSGSVNEPLELQDPTEVLDPKRKAVMAELQAENRPFWLIVHSGPLQEIDCLLVYAEELRKLDHPEVRLVLISPKCPVGLATDVKWIDFYPASLLFP